MAKRIVVRVPQKRVVKQPRRPAPDAGAVIRHKAPKPKAPIPDAATVEEENEA